MLKINSISNVNNTLKSNLSFKAGVQTNYGVKENSDNLVEGSFFTGFVGILNECPLISSRANKIKQGVDETKLNLIA